MALYPFQVSSIVLAGDNKPGKNVTRKTVPPWAFLVPAALWLLAAVIPVLKGERLKTTFFVLALVFAILGGVVARRNRSTDTDPPAG